MPPTLLFQRYPEVFYDFIMEVLKAVSRDDYLEFVEEIQTKMKRIKMIIPPANKYKIFSTGSFLIKNW